jgi:hypothetical protein
MSQIQDKPSQPQDLALGVIDDEEDDFLLDAGGDAPKACPLDPDGKSECEACS